MSDSAEGSRKLRVTVRTPAGVPHDFDFREEELVAEAAAKAIAHFVDKHELESGDYGLELVRDGTATDLLDTNTLRDYEVKDGDVLHLIPEKPQVDG